VPSFVSDLVARVVSKRDLLMPGGWDGIFPRKAQLGAAPSSTGGKERGRAFCSAQNSSGF